MTVSARKKCWSLALLFGCISLASSFLLYQIFYLTAPDYYIRTKVLVEIGGETITLESYSACKLVTTAPIGGGGMRYAVRNPEAVGLRLQDNRGLFLMATDACMWPYFRSRDFVGDWWKGQSQLEGVIPLLVANSFDDPSLGDFYAYEVGYKSPGSEIKYISGTITMSDERSYSDWLEKAQSDSHNFYTQPGYNFWSLDPHRESRIQREARQVSRAQNTPPVRSKLDISCFSLIKIPQEYINETVNIPENVITGRARIQAWMAAPENDMRLLPEDATGTGTPEAWSQFSLGDSQYRDIQYGIIPYGAGGIGESYYYLDFSLNDLTFRFNETRRGVMSCAKPPTEKSYQSYEFTLLARDHRYQIGWGSKLYMSPNLYDLSVGSPRIR